MAPYRLLNLRPPLTSPRRSGVPPGKARRIRPPRLRRYAHRFVCFARRQGTSAPGPCPSVARSAPGPVGGAWGLRALCGGDVRSPFGGGGGLGGRGGSFRAPPTLGGGWNHRQSPRGAPLFHTQALRSGGGTCLGGGRSSHPGPRGGRTSPITGYTCLGGGGGAAQGVVGASFKAHGEPSSSMNRAHQPGGERGVQPKGWSEPPARPVGSHHPPRTGRTGPGGTGSPAEGVVGASFKAYGGPSSSENRAHRPGGDGESSPGGGRGILYGLWGAIIFGEPGAPAWGGRGVQPRGWSEPTARPVGSHHPPRTGRTGLGGTGSPAQGVVGASFKAYGGPSSSENRAHRPGGDGVSSPGGGRSLLQGPWGAIISQEPGAPARGERGVQPGGWSEHSSGVGGTPCGAGGEAAVSLGSAYLPGGGGGGARGRAVTGGRLQGGHVQRCARASWGVPGPLLVGGRCCVPRGLPGPIAASGRPSSRAPGWVLRPKGRTNAPPQRVL